MRSVVFLFLIFSLSACHTSAPSKIIDKHTGTTIVRSANFIAKDNLFYRLNATPFHSSTSGFGIETSFNGTLGWNFFNEAWSFGNRLPFSVSDRRVVSSNITVETGVITLTKTQFLKAAQDGFEFKLVGQRGSIEGSIPASSFMEVLNMQNSTAN